MRMTRRFARSVSECNDGNIRNIAEERSVKDPGRIAKDHPVFLGWVRNG